MSKIRCVRDKDRTFEKIGGPPGNIRAGRDVSKNESKSFGASIVIYEDCDMEWTVLYDEYIYILEGELNLETKEGTFDLRPGDGIWLPENTWMVYRAKYAKTLIAIHPVNWRDLRGM